MSQYFRAVAYWDEREESVEQCAERLSRFIVQLSGVSPHLANWYTSVDADGDLPDEIDWSTYVEENCDTPNVEVSVDHHYLQELLKSGRNRDESSQRRVIKELGFHIIIWNGGEPDKDEALMDIVCGSYAPRCAPNHVMFDMPLAWFNVDSAVALLRAMVSCWSPRMAAFCSNRALLKTFEQMPGDIEVPVIDWVFFHRLPRSGELRPPSRVAFELNGGECIVVQDTPVRPDHVHERSRVREISKLLGLDTCSSGNAGK